jgi:hypothetical protein
MSDVAKKDLVIEGAAEDLNLEHLRITAPSIPGVLALDELTFANNVRDVSEYNLPPLIESMQRTGFLANHPIVVNHETATGVHEVLCGNRRGNALKNMSPEGRAKALANFGGKIPVVIYTDLPESLKEIIRCDHSTDEDRQPLSSYGLFVATLRLLRAALTQAEIAVRLGQYKVKDGKKSPNRSLIQQFCNIARLPGFVQEMFKVYWLEGKGTIRMSDAAALFKIWNAEFATYGIDDRVGPEFEAAVKAIKERNSAAPKTTKTLTAAAAADTAKMVASPVTRKVLIAATNADPKALQSLDRELAARDEIMTLVDWCFKNEAKKINALFDKAKSAIAEEKAAAAEKAKEEAEAARNAVAADPSLVATQQPS